MFPIVNEIEIVTDEQGRFSLNSLHRASGISKHKAQNKWLETGQARELISRRLAHSWGARLCSPLVKTDEEAESPDAYADLLLAIAYARWMSLSFQLNVNSVLIGDRETGSLKTEKLSMPSIMTIENVLFEIEKTKQRVSAVEEGQVDINKRIVYQLITDMRSLCEEYRFDLNEFNEFCGSTGAAMHMRQLIDLVEIANNKITTFAELSGKRFTSKFRKKLIYRAFLGLIKKYYPDYRVGKFGFIKAAIKYHLLSVPVVFSDAEIECEEDECDFGFCARGCDDRIKRFKLPRACKSAKAA